MDMEHNQTLGEDQYNEPATSGISKKLQKRLLKIEKSLTQKEKLTLTHSPTKILCVQNGGLGNDVCQEDLMSIFTQYGTVECIIMLPRKPYAFVCYTDASCAFQAFQHLNAYTLKAGEGQAQNVILYLFFVERAPSSVVPSSERPPGLHILEEFITEQEESQLLEYFSVDVEDQKESGVMKHRQVRHFGYEFKYGVNDVDINDPLPEGIPDVCCSLLEKSLTTGFVHHFPDQLTINQYKPGQGIPPHVDTTYAFEDGIMSLSLGSQTVMDFRHPDGRHLSVIIPQRSLLIMTQDSRYIWSHGITPKKSDIVPSPGGDGLTMVMREQRVSLTFRKVVMDRKEKGIEEKEAVLPQTDQQAVALEKEHVQQVYDDIAEHFSGTRYKPWPRVVEFIQEQPSLSLLADVGCGNGKCLGLHNQLFEIGSDFSKNLASICRSRGNETCVADVTCLPFRSAAFDAVLCIAVIHHMATKDRRHKAVSEVVRILRSGGKALIYVWAMEQDLQQKPSKYIHVNRQKKLEGEAEEISLVNSLSNVCSLEVAGSSEATSNVERGQRSGGVGETSVKDSKASVEAGKILENSKRKDYTENMPHNNFSKNVISHVSPVTADKSLKVETSFERNVCEENNENNSSQIISTRKKSSDCLSNSKNCQADFDCEKPSVKKLHVHVNRTQFQEQDMLVPWQLTKASKSSETSGGAKKDNVFHRYYHMFRQGELEAVCKRVPGCVVKKSYYDQGNWCVILEKV